MVKINPYFKISKGFILTKFGKAKKCFEYDLELFTPTSHGVYFTNVLRKDFMNADPKSAKRQLSHQCLFALLGSPSIKATHKM